MKSLRATFLKHYDSLRKRSKFLFYAQGVLLLIAPGWFFRRRRSRYLHLAQEPALQRRVEYYCKIRDHSKLSQSATAIGTFKKTGNSAYFFDMLSVIKFWPTVHKFDFLPGDVTHVPATPTIVKSRPIHGDNQNSVLLKLNQIRHFNFVDDTLAFEQKKDAIVWRGHIENTKKARIRFLEAHIDNPRVNAGFTSQTGAYPETWRKPFMSIPHQLQYKFILCAEGHDVATNLKYTMSSNSLALMAQPVYETWFMEGLLQPNVHFVLVQDDYSDLDQQMQYYIDHPHEARTILANAHRWVEQFRDHRKEMAVSQAVLEKYFRLTG